MEKYRILKREGNRIRGRVEPYRVHLDSYDSSRDKDEISLKLFDERDENNAIMTIVFQPEDISGRDYLHFFAQESEGKWDIRFRDDLKFSRVVIPEK
jgi:hypothetical protein